MSPHGDRAPEEHRRVLLGAAVLALGRLLRRRPRTRALPAADLSDRADPPEIGGDPRRRAVPANAAAERAVATLLVLCAVGFLGFVAVYAADGHDTQLLGIAAGVGLVSLAAGAIVAGLHVVPQETSVEPREPLPEPPAAREVLEIVQVGAQGISRRRLLLGAGGAAGAAAVAAAATPLASLGPGLASIHSTPWRRGVRLVDEQGRPYAAADVEVASFYTALPEGGDAESFGASLLVVRLPTSMISLPPARRGWAPQGLLAYSKICPHAGCAISLYRYPLYPPTSVAVPAFTCPCHYSTFAPGEGGRVLFGPAGRSLPQLPLMIDAAGELRAAGPFDEDIGPAWWGTRRSES
jgi:ubiquinol-cytochrome c reductase iron-sulfur subunit